MSENGGLALWIIGGLGVAEILDYFSISGEWLIIMSVMLVVDFIFWIISAKSRGENIESKKRQHGLVKKASRWILPFIVAGGLKWTGMSGVDLLVNTIVWMIVFSELYSIIGHIYSINYGEELPEMDAFKILINKLSNFIRGVIKKESDKIDEEKPNSDGDQE